MVVTRERDLAPPRFVRFSSSERRFHQMIDFPKVRQKPRERRRPGRAVPALAAVHERPETLQQRRAVRRNQRAPPPRPSAAPSTSTRRRPLSAPPRHPPRHPPRRHPPRRHPPRRDPPSWPSTPSPPNVARRGAFPSRFVEVREDLVEHRRGVSRAQRPGDDASERPDLLAQRRRELRRASRRRRPRSPPRLRPSSFPALGALSVKTLEHQIVGNRDEWCANRSRMIPTVLACSSSRASRGPRRSCRTRRVNRAASTGRKGSSAADKSGVTSDEKPHALRRQREVLRGYGPQPRGSHRPSAEHQLARSAVEHPQQLRRLVHRRRRGEGKRAAAAT